MSYITTNISPSQGFHPISTNLVHLSPGSSSLAQCSLHLYFKLPPLLFVDPHELSQRNNTYTFHHWGSRDLEKPVHASREVERGSDVLLNVRLPSSIHDDGRRHETSASSQMWNVTVELPMHLRYGVPAPPSLTSGSEKPYEHVQVDAPIAFLLCKASPTLVDNATQLPALLPPHITAFLPKAPPNIFIPIPAHPEFLSAKADLSYMNVITVPLGSISDLPLVESLTSLTIIICFCWLAIVSWKTSLRLTRVPRNLKQE
ncbi:hypothetical protein BYT27DRAFT_7125175 [Phlegmacium glaucopus]|nr:hypothetical protein BYT27DRAFT_7125175 [Phlegmacium glaucopus]